MTATQPSTTQEALAALKWQLDIGIDEALETEPVRLAEAAAPLPAIPPAADPAPSIYKSLPASAPLPVRASAAPPIPAPSIDLKHVATLADLKSAMEQIQNLGIKDTAMNLVFGEGPLQPPVMLIGEAPGEEEDRSGRPFIGRAGQLLEKMISAVGFTRDQVYITNVLPWRPPGNRTPKVDEVATCLPFLMRHIEIVQPKLLLLLGGPSAKALLGKEESVTRMRGIWWEYHSPGLPAPLPALVTYHPAYLLRTPLAKRESWRDLRLLKKKIAPV